MARLAAAIRRWFYRRRYQYNVTLPLYMLSPTERFVFNSIVFLLLAMVCIAAILYLPEHVMTIAGRVSYYWYGTCVDPVVALGSGWQGRQTAGEVVEVVGKSLSYTTTVGLPVESEAAKTLMGWEL